MIKFPISDWRSCSSREFSLSAFRQPDETTWLLFAIITTFSPAVTDWWGKRAFAVRRKFLWQHRMWVTAWQRRVALKTAAAPAAVANASHLNRKRAGYRLRSRDLLCNRLTGRSNSSVIKDWWDHFPSAPLPPPPAHLCVTAWRIYVAAEGALPEAPSEHPGPESG